MHVLLKLSIFLVFIFSLSTTANATMYFYWDAEDHPCDGSELPSPPFWTARVDARGHVSCEPSPQGNRHIEFTTVANQLDHYTEINRTQDGNQLSLTNIIGKTIYLAYYFNFTRINGQDIWHERNSGDKGFEITGNGIRWTLARGHSDHCRGSYSAAPNQDHRYNVRAGNPSYHLNPDREQYGTNLNGYSCANPIQLEYERWYSAVMAVKIANDATGSLAVYIDGVKVIEDLNIRTAGNDNPTITSIHFGGTIAQAAYDAPPHHRKFDAIMLTDNWQDIIDGGYLDAVTIPKAPVAY